MYIQNIVISKIYIFVRWFEVKMRKFYICINNLYVENLFLWNSYTYTATYRMYRDIQSKQFPKLFTFLYQLNQKERKE